MTRLRFGRRVLSAIAFSVAVAVLGSRPQVLAAGTPSEIHLDYAYYNPVSLLIKEKGWVEEEFRADGIAVRWVLSLGSNKALEFLNGNNVDFGSSAGAAALLAKAIV